jgi:hypothetical protein
MYGVLKHLLQEAVAENSAFTALFSGEHVRVASCAPITRGGVF